MPRYKLSIEYDGSPFLGWQVQESGLTVAGVLEDAAEKLSGERAKVSGSGRTDTGVHAMQYFAHTDLQNPLPEQFLSRLNKILPSDIAVEQLIEMPQDAHARFDAESRAYAYQLEGKKNPFSCETAAFIYNFADLNFEKMQEAAALLMQYRFFFPFCKSNSDAKTMECQLYQSEWQWNLQEKTAVYHIAANRFLRGMVRLIVGMCLNVGAGKLSIETLARSLEEQQLLHPSTSAPPQGLALTEVRYPYLKQENGLFRLVS